MAALITGSHKSREIPERELEKYNHLNPMNKIDESIFGRKSKQIGQQTTAQRTATDKRESFDI